MRKHSMSERVFCFIVAVLVVLLAMSLIAALEDGPQTIEHITGESNESIQY